MLSCSFRIDQTNHRVSERVQHELLRQVGRPQLEAKPSGAEGGLPRSKGRDLRQEKGSSK